MAELIASEPSEQKIVEDLLERISNMWVPWADRATPQPHILLDDIIAMFTRTAPSAAPGAPSAAPNAEDTAARLLQLLTVHEGEPDWGGSEDEEVTPDVVPLNLSVFQLPRPPPRRWTRIGIDLGGVLLPNVRNFHRLNTLADLARLGLVAGADTWFKACVLHCGPENVFIISYMRNTRMQVLCSEFLLGDDGLMATSGVPASHLIWTNTKIAKGGPFMGLGLNTFVDDGIDALVSIRAACWKNRARIQPFIPSALDGGSFSDFGRCCGVAKRASDDWPVP